MAQDARRQRAICSLEPKREKSTARPVEHSVAPMYSTSLRRAAASAPPCAPLVRLWLSRLALPSPRAFPCGRAA